MGTKLIGEESRSPAEPNPLTKIDQDLAHERAQATGEEKGFNYSKLFEPLQGPKTKPVNKFLDGFNKILRPYARAPEAAQVIGEQLARERLNNERAFEALQSGIGKWDLTSEEGKQLADDIESGKANSIPVIQALRNEMDAAWKRVVEVRPDAAPYFIKNYLGRLFKNPDTAEPTLVRLGNQKASLGGRGSFLHNRVLPSMREAIEAGLEPLDKDLISMQLLKIREMNRYVAASRYIKELNARGLGHFIGATEDVPPGYVYVDDRIAGVDATGRRLKAKFIAPEPVATLLNHHLAPGFRGNPLYDVYRSVGNSLNMWQLGFSTFHAALVTLESSISEVANSLRQVSRGAVSEGVSNLIKSPVAAVKYFTQGSRMLYEGLHPGSAFGAEMAPWVEKALRGGANFRMDEFYRTGGPEAFMKALKQRSVLGMGKSFLPALVETASAPVMKGYVPRIKLGAFMSLAKEELARLPEGATKAMEDQALTRALASVDNRFGQLAYDNLFWHKALKDLSMVAVRSVGWNLGTIREILGGAADVARLKNTPKASYVIALPVTVGLIGAITTYLMTGEQPKDYRDYYFPRTGKFNLDGSAERMQFPTYMRDVFDYADDPVKTIQGKVHPEIKAIAAMLSDEEFQGKPIRNPSDPLVKQAQDEAMFMLSQWAPISARNAASEHSPLLRSASAAGITPAPKRVTNVDLTEERQRVRFGTAPEASIPVRKEMDKDRRQISLLNSNIRRVSSNKAIPPEEKQRILGQLDSRRSAIVADLQKRARRLVDLTNTARP